MLPKLPATGDEYSILTTPGTCLGTTPGTCLSTAQVQLQTVHMYTGIVQLGPNPVPHLLCKVAIFNI